MNQPDFENSQFTRGVSNFPAPSGGGPSNAEIMAAIVALKEEVRDLRHTIGGLKTAFPRNDLGEPDFDGHRMDHVIRVKRDERFESLKMSGAVKLVGVVAATLMMVFMSGLGVHLQKLIGGN